MMKRGELTRLEIGGCVRIKRSELQQLIESSCLNKEVF
jgi:hypothetical protein